MANTPKPAPEAGGSPVSAFVARRRIKLPVPGPTGEDLFVVIQAAPWDEMVEAMGRLPGELPASLKARAEASAEAEGEADQEQDFQAIVEAMQNLKHDYAVLLPTISQIVRLGAVEPRFSFNGEADPTMVPWHMVPIKNQTAIFNGIIALSGFGGGAAERVGRFRAGGESRGAGRVRGVRSGEDQRPPAV